MSNNFANPDLDFEVNWTIDAIRAADALGIPAVRIDAMMHGEEETPPERNIKVFSQAMRRVLDATSDSKLDLGIENHGYQGNRPDFLEAVFAAVGSPRLGLTIDTGNFYWYGWPLSRVYEIIEQFAPYCKHTHAKNISYPPEMRETQRPVGLEYGKYVRTMAEGDIDHKRVVSILKAGGYDRDLCLEDESLGKFPREEWRKVLKADADYFRSVLQSNG
jgi:sugar phosphate isomerase/epimerase